MFGIQIDMVKYKILLRGILLSCLIISLVVSLYLKTFLWLFERFTAADSYYSHGFLIPIVSGVLIFLKRNELWIKEGGRSNIIGIIVSTFAIVIQLVSTMTDVFFLGGFSFILLVYGISLMFLGPSFTKKILFPIMFLFFMVPLPLVAINAISFPLKMLVTKAAIFFLRHAMNLPVSNEGFQIYFPNASVTIENPCSGLRSLISMIALGCLFSYLFPGKLFKKIILVISSVPVAILTNFIRVIILCLGIYIYGEKLSKSFFHDFTGLLSFAIAFLILIWIKKCLE